MENRTIDNVKLGIFVFIGLVFLIFTLYMVNKGSSFFSKNYMLRVQFSNVSGLMLGNNVRYAGIQVGTVKKIRLLNDTVIEVSLLIKEDMNLFIHKDDIVSIGTDGLVGNKLINITPGQDRTTLAVDNDLLLTKKNIDTDEMLEVLNKTNKNIAAISEDLKSTVQRLNHSTAFWKILSDNSLPDNLNKALVNVRNATNKADNLVAELQTVVQTVKDGKGTLGGLLKDTAMLVNLNAAVDKIKIVGDNANHLATQLNTLTLGVKEDIDNGKGTVNAVLKDSAMVQKFNKTLDNIEEGTANFNQNMEALKHNFFFKGYFKRLEKQKKKEEEALKAKKAAGL
jgi:phospholipid/cholesterol/gamma-HCH transport system substrate-binding protein